MTSSCSRRIATRHIVAIAILVIAAGLVVASDPAWAQTNPFGGPRPPAAPLPASGGVVGWILTKQNEFYRQFSSLIRAAKVDGSVMWALLGVSFLYGIFHAAGPGHGKAVISSYLVANDETWRRGIVLSFASAMLQAIVAVAVVGLAALLFQASRRAICNADPYIEMASYGLIALIGARLTWVKGRGFLRALAVQRSGHDPHEHRGHTQALAHDDDAQIDHDDHAGHAHGPEPQELAGPGGWKRGLSAIFAVGLRPCSGAILVLVFALSQQFFWAGVVSTVVMGIGTAITVAAIATVAVSAKDLAKKLATHASGVGSLVMRAIEVGAAALVLVFGAALLAGYMVSERLTMAC